MRTDTSPELLARSHYAIEGLGLDVRSTRHAAARTASLSEFSVLVATHIGCLQRIVMPALASEKPSNTRALVLENLAGVDRAVLAAMEPDVSAAEFDARFESLESALRLQFELETELLFPMLLAMPGGSEPLAQKIEMYAARMAQDAARDVHWFQRGLR